MRIGILTFSHALNLGAALQAFSLLKTLEEMGYDAELIDYRCPAIEAMHRFRPVIRTHAGIRKRLNNLCYNTVFLPRRLRYYVFQRSEKRSRTYTPKTISRADGKYDVYITGSDQVFSLKLTGADTAFFLDFVSSAKKISYAASLGTYQPERKQDYKRLLNAFDKLSVREKSAAALIRRELSLNTETMPDPVFLHSAAEWRRLLKLNGKVKEQYVLIYALIEESELYNFADRIAKARGLKVYAITKALKPKGKAHRFFRNVGPKEFVQLLIHSAFVLTNSFHGTAFSLIFEKQFIVFLPPTAPERIKDILSFVGIESRVIGSASALFPEEIDYKLIRDKIHAMMQQGRRYLQITENKVPRRGHL